MMFTSFRSLPALGLLLASTAGSLPGQPTQPATLAYRTQTPIAEWSRAIKLIDLDGDSRAEIIVGNWTRSAIEIWKYNAATQLVELQQRIGICYHPHGVNAADMDKDGDIDIVVAIRSCGVWLLRNEGAGAFTPLQLHPEYSWNVQIADFDQDSNLDIFDATDSLSRILYGNGAGGFTLATQPEVWKAWGVNAIDVNHDGRPDLIGPDLIRQKLVVHLNLGSRNWSADVGPTDLYPNQLTTQGTPSAADFNADGYVDQLTVHYAANGYIPPETRSVWNGGLAPGGALTWTRSTLNVSTLRTLPLITADVNDDGKPDILAGGAAGGQLGFQPYVNDGTGQFALASVTYDGQAGYPTGIGYQNSLAVGDINGDGLSDVVAARHVPGSWEPSAGFVVLFRYLPEKLDPFLRLISQTGAMEVPPCAPGKIFRVTATWRNLGPASYRYVAPALVTLTGGNTLIESLIGQTADGIIVPQEQFPGTFRIRLAACTSFQFLVSLYGERLP